MGWGFPSRSRGGPAHADRRHTSQAWGAGYPRTIGPGAGLGVQPRPWGGGARGGGRAGNDPGRVVVVQRVGSGPAEGTRGLGGETTRGGRGAGAPGGGRGRALTVGFPGQLLHNFGLQLAVGFPHPRRPRPPVPGPDPGGAPRGNGSAGAGRGGRGGAHGGRRAERSRAGAAPLSAPCPRGPGAELRRAALRCASGGASAVLGAARARGRRAAAGQAGPSAAALSRRRGASCVGLGAGAAAVLRGRPWLLSSAAHARGCAPCAPASRLPPAPRARGGPGAATQRPAPPPAPHPPRRACARGTAAP